MKRANDLMPRILEPDNLRLAFWKASKGKRYTQEVLDFQSNLEPNLCNLREQISTGLLDVGKYRYFKVFEPKERQICASAFSEQVLHHALMNVCHDYFERHQVFDSYASRKGKGVHAALVRAKHFNKSQHWYLKLDVRKFFDSVHHGVLKAQLARMFKEHRILDIFGKIIDSYEASPGRTCPPEEQRRGLPIGNLTSQYFANHFLSGLDHFIREDLRIGAAVRYMDDIVLWHENKPALKNAFRSITEYVETNLQCALKPEILAASKRGLTFLGYRIFPDRVELSQQSKRRFIRKIRALQENYDSGAWSESVCQRHALPLLAFLAHAKTRNFRESVDLQQWSIIERATTA
jgi:RNA-directed DNA polymerase